MGEALFFKGSFSQAKYSLIKTIEIDPNNKSAKQMLTEQSVGWGEHYPRAVHLQPAFAHLGARGDFPVSETICENILSLPMFPELDTEMVHDVCDVLLRADGV